MESLLDRATKKNVLLLFSGSLFTVFVVKLSYNWYQRYLLRVRLHQKHSELEEIRSSTLLKLPIDENFSYLCDLDISSLSKEIRSGKVRPIDILRMFQCRAATLLKQNCVAEVILEADEEAIEMMKLNNTKNSCLFGVPVSIKENFQIKGYESPLGLVKFLGYRAEEDCVLVKVLKLAGAIPFVTSTMAPGGLSLDTSTSVYGEQRNPFDKNRASGGSSGGEAVLIAGGGSPLGFGNDISGSLRIPAALCGISSLKPTFRRVSQIGIFTSYRKNIAGVDICVGPMAKKVDSLACAMKCILGPDMFSLDPSVVPMPFDEQAFDGSSKKSLVIGYYIGFVGDLQIASVPSIKRVVLEAKSILEKFGHTLVEFQPPEIDHATKLLFSALTADGGNELSSITKYEPLPKHMRLLSLSFNLPNAVKRLAGWILSHLGRKISGYLVSSSAGCYSTVDLLNLLSQIAEYRRLFAKKMTQSNSPIDVLICPVLPYPAPLVNTPELYLYAAISYCGLYNLLDYPAGAVPVSRVICADVLRAKSDEKVYSSRGDVANLCISRMQVGSEGLPLAVQVVGKPMHEEVVLRVMQEIESGANFRL